MGSYLIILPLAYRVDPDQAALTRAARSGSALFAKASKSISMRYRVKEVLHPFTLFKITLSLYVSSIKNSMLYVGMGNAFP